MPSWWVKPSKGKKENSNRGSIIGLLHRKHIKPDAPRRHCNDITSENEFQSSTDSPSPSSCKQVSRWQSFGERAQPQPLPLPHRSVSNISPSGSGNAFAEPPIDKTSKNLFSPPPRPGHVKIGQHAVVGERDYVTDSNSSDSSSDIADLSHSHHLSPQTSDFENGVECDTACLSGLKLMDRSTYANKNNSGEVLKPVNILLNHQSIPASPKRRHVKSKVSHLQIPRQGAFLSAPCSSISSPSRSPVKVFNHEPATNGSFWLGKPYVDISLVESGQCLSPGSGHYLGHDSIAGDVPCQCHCPECSHLHSPGMPSPGPSSRINSGAVTPHRPCAGGSSAPTAWPDDGKQQSYPLPLPPASVSNPSLFTSSYSTGTSPRVPRSPHRADNPPSPGSCWKKGRLLGRGTFGHVYLGFNSESGEMRAMKEVTLLSDDAKSRECTQQLGQEIALLSRLRHQNIVQYYGSEMVDDKLYIYLEYVSGGSIYKILQDYGQLGEAAIRSYTQQILLGLVYLHGKNTLHRDIKGANILVGPNGRVKLADFGMAKHITGQSCPLSFKGSPYWMAPEVIKNSGSCSLAVDIWSLGCTVLEMATSKPPWSQYEGVAALFKIGNSKELPEIPDHLSYEGKDFVLHCLQRNPYDRPTAAQLLEHPFVKNYSPFPSPGAESTASVHTHSHAVRTQDFGHTGTPPYVELLGEANHLRSPKYRPGYSDGYAARNVSCPVSPVGSPLPHSRPHLQISGGLSPSPLSSPQVASGASTPPGPGNIGTPKHSKTINHVNEGMDMVAMFQNTFHQNGLGLHESRPNIFRGIVQAHLSAEAVSQENDILGDRFASSIAQNQKKQLDAHLVLANCVSQQLLRNPVRLNSVNPNSPVPNHESGT